MVASKHLRLAVETEEERRPRLDGRERKARLEKMTATKRFRLAIKNDEETIARLEKMVATTQPRLALETEDKKKNGLIWM